MPTKTSAKDVKFTWPLLRDHLQACQIYLASREILIRPLVPPTWTHAPFEGAKQRIYMSATLGAGGDLERLTGPREDRPDRGTRKLSHSGCR